MWNSPFTLVRTSHDLSPRLSVNALDGGPVTMTDSIRSAILSYSGYTVSVRMPSAVTDSVEYSSTVLDVSRTVRERPLIAFSSRSKAVFITVRGVGDSPAVTFASTGAIGMITSGISNSHQKYTRDHSVIVP